ncbi:MAG: flagellar hook basal-body protein [Candidatus Brocadiales bacterium]|nr:flagellar hook basal-body protein [Candidatus Brocadiales bacterium]
MLIKTSTNLLSDSTDKQVCPCHPVLQEGIKKLLIGLYTAASELDAMSKNQDIIARNLANANTDGYKRCVCTFKTILLSAEAGVQDSTTPTVMGTTISTVAADLTPGKLAFTGSDFDLAIKGEGFFTIQTDNGLMYTRRGRFILSPKQEIITPEGGQLLSNAGVLQLPPGGKKVHVDGTGIVSVDGANIGTLKITHFPDPNSLTQNGGCTFKSTAIGNIGEDAKDFEIAQGYIEKSNVDVVGEMIAMIANMRSYEMGYKAATSMSNTLDGLIKLAAQAG